MSEPQREALTHALAIGDVEASCNALLALVHGDDDPDWLQSKCLELLGHPSADICGLAATCLGHVARLHGVARQDVIAGLLAVRDDPVLKGRVSDALDDIARYAQ